MLSWHMASHTVSCLKLTSPTTGGRWWFGTVPLIIHNGLACLFLMSQVCVVKVTLAWNRLTDSQANLSDYHKRPWHTCLAEKSPLKAEMPTCACYISGPCSPMRTDLMTEGRMSQWQRHDCHQGCNCLVCSQTSYQANRREQQSSWRVWRPHPFSVVSKLPLS